MTNTLLPYVALITIILVLPAILASIMPSKLSLSREESFTTYSNGNSNDITLHELARRINEFSLKLYGEVLEKYHDRNIVVSPFSVYTVLTLLYEATSSSTRSEISSAIGLANTNVCKAYKELLSSLPVASDKDTTLIIANAIWFRRGLRVKNEYTRLVSECYDARIGYFDSIDQLASSINKWINTKSKGLIRELVDENSLSKDIVAIMVSAIYFKARWIEEFKPAKPISFWTGRRNVEVPAMELISDELKVVHGYGYIAVEIPYKDTNISMTIIVPNNYSSILYRYRELIIDALGKLAKSNFKGKIRLVMPKFNITLRIDLVEILKDMGIREAFMPGKADLTKMINGDIGSIWVNKVVHQAAIKVNEWGTMASATTSIVVVETLPAVDEQIVIDKPFIYILRDKASNTILFIGHVVNPIEA